MFPERGKKIIFKFINKAVWDLYPIYKKTFHFQKHMTKKNTTTSRLCTLVDNDLLVSGVVSTLTHTSEASLFEV